MTVSGWKLYGGYEGVLIKSQDSSEQLLVIFRIFIIITIIIYSPTLFWLSSSSVLDYLLANQSQREKSHSL